jgi:aminopeptidase N
MTLTLRQQRYLKSGDLSAAEESESPIWWIPIGVVTNKSPKKSLSLILTEKEGTITFVNFIFL